MSLPLLCEVLHAHSAVDSGKTGHIAVIVMHSEHHIDNDSTCGLPFAEVTLSYLCVQVETVAELGLNSKALPAIAS